MTRPANPAPSWLAIAYGTAALLAYQGAGYLVGGPHAISNTRNWDVLLALLPGRIRCHGAVLLALGLLLAYSAWQPDEHYRRLSGALWALRCYCLFVGGCWVASWFRFGLVWGAPGWWLYLAGASIWLTAYGPRRPQKGATGAGRR